MSSSQRALLPTLSVMLYPSWRSEEAAAAPLFVYTPLQLHILHQKAQKTHTSDYRRQCLLSTITYSVYKQKSAIISLTFLLFLFSSLLWDTESPQTNRRFYTLYITALLPETLIHTEPRGFSPVGELKALRTPGSGGHTRCESALMAAP